MNLGLSLLRHSKLDQDGNVRVPVRGFSPDASSDLDRAWEKMDEDARFRQLHPGPVQASIEEAIRKRRLQRGDGRRFMRRREAHGSGEGPADLPLQEAPYHAVGRRCNFLEAAKSAN